MALHKSEQEWIRNNLENGEKIASSTDRDYILEELMFFTTEEIQNHEFTTDLCREAEDIMERIGRFWDMKDPDEKEDQYV